MTYRVTWLTCLTLSVAACGSQTTGANPQDVATDVFARGDSEPDDISTLPDAAPQDVAADVVTGTDSASADALVLPDAPTEDIATDVSESTDSPTDDTSMLPDADVDAGTNSEPPLDPVSDGGGLDTSGETVGAIDAMPDAVLGPEVLVDAGDQDANLNADVPLASPDDAMVAETIGVDAVVSPPDEDIEQPSGLCLSVESCEPIITFRTSGGLCVSADGAAPCYSEFTIYGDRVWYFQSQVGAAFGQLEAESYDALLAAMEAVDWATVPVEYGPCCNSFFDGSDTYLTVPMCDKEPLEIRISDSSALPDSLESVLTAVVQGLPSEVTQWADDAPTDPCP